MIFVENVESVKYMVGSYFITENTASLYYQNVRMVLSKYEEVGTFKI